MNFDPDADLVARVGKGDRAAAQVLMARHLPRMLALARRMLPERAEAEDIVQESFLKLWTNAAKWRPGQAKFETWLYRVTLNLCYDRLRKKPSIGLDAVANMPDPGPPPDTGLDHAVMATAIEEALATLPDRQKAAILLCHYQERGNVEAAEILGVSVEALESLLSRGRRSLRTKLAHLKDA
ncbi:MAG: RNA polymerase sigma factor [Alphaproteobacteria bacterium]|nr:RNA polymerase sigma factor [Alphaproteobacteria bacterium]